ncbi:hypothetical protein E2562_020544 [Oryza meyeriana var. granulata]|uniref:Uncharacterized protein n=1 Tax=Oryza meyeriana var. granulata TaxID=110450 RepID=A0A6G1EBG9_9ORYZ|nr:hypothetical protein E2562_020544 [Oryza meyeriana var. granulata]
MAVVGSWDNVLASGDPIFVFMGQAAAEGRCRWLIVVVAWFRSNGNEEQRGPAASSPADGLSSCRRTFHSQVVMHTEDEATWTMQTKAKTKPPKGLKTKTMLATWIKDETPLASDIEANMTPATRIKDGRRPAN